MSRSDMKPDVAFGKVKLGYYDDSTGGADNPFGKGTFWYEAEATITEHFEGKPDPVVVLHFDDPKFPVLVHFSVDTLKAMLNAALDMWQSVAE